MPQVKISQCLNERPSWLRAAAKHLLESGSVNDQDYIDLQKLCIDEVLGLSTGAGYTLPANAFDSIAANKIKLTTIGNIEGINALAPKEPLTFGGSNLAVVYGQNGAGKSGYVRILKHLCGARHPGKLHYNVYLAEPSVQKCTIGYEKNDVPVTENWEASSGFLPDLKSVDIFDASCGKVYVAAESEVTYEPPALSFLSELIAVSEVISKRIDDAIEKLPSTKPVLPKEFLNTAAGKWYENLTAKTKEVAVTKNCSWSDKDMEHVVELKKRLSEKDPSLKAKKIRQQQVHLQQIIDDTQKSITQLSDVNCSKIFSAKTVAVVASETAKVAAKQVFSSAPLEGVGSDIWKQLWEHARLYSQEVAYVERKFPHVEDDALCVLCHQPLSDEAKTRMVSFEDFVKGTAQKAADTAQTSVSDLLEVISDIASVENLTTKLDATGMARDENFAYLLELYAALQSRKTSLAIVDKLEDLPKLPKYEGWTKKAQELLVSYDESAKKYEDDSKAEDRSGVIGQLNEFLGREWLFQQRKSIEKEIDRLQKVQVLNTAKKNTNTRALSIKKGELAEVLITDAFVARFNKELENLGAKHIKIELIKSKITKGKVLHRLRLLDSNIDSPEDVLSEGEHRIVSLAAFLADVTGKCYSAPFVFDDPISSLDQPFEEAVVHRLVALSKERQVIVLTHRLSLLGLIQDYAKKATVSPEIICIRKEAWGTGEPGGTPLFAKKPERALKVLIDERLVKARKLLGEHGQEVYEPYAKALCSDFRILVERMVECHLLADVVQRYRRAINTMGKIEGLAKISRSDCTLIDDMMTKYSRYEHSQPVEAPVAMPLPEELETDFTKLQSWHSEFTKRPIEVPIEAHA